MAATFKPILDDDVTTTKTNKHEQVPITGSIVSGTFGDNNIKNYGHGMHQSVYDYPYLSSSAHLLFDLTVGYSSDSSLSSSANVQNSKKINIYNQMALQLMGTDVTGSIQKFDQDGNIAAGGTKLKECHFYTFSRLLVKDEIKKGSFRMTLFQDGPGTPGGATSEVVLGDYGADNEFKVNSPVGEYGILYTSSATPNANSGVGLLFYQAGVAVMTSSFYTGSNPPSSPASNFYDLGTDSGSVDTIMTGSTIEINADAIRNRIKDIEFNNTTEINSTIYFIRANHNEFNYSANPTYTSGSKIVTKNSANDLPISYITTIGLYSADNELLAVVKLSEAMKKRGDTPAYYRVRLDY